MSSARRTPRYVDAIGSDPIGPQLMGPQPAPLPTEPHRGVPGVLPLRHPQPSIYRPGSDAAPLSIAQPLVPARGRPVVPVGRRPWRVLVVSAEPGTAPRSFEVPRWQARAALAALVIVTTLACGFAAAVVVAVGTPDIFAGPAELSLLRSELAATQDSLAELRADVNGSQLGESGDVTDSLSSNADSGAASPKAFVPLTPAAHLMPDERPKPRSVRAAHHLPGGLDVSSGMVSGMSRSLVELPVIGALVSGFSLARRHPLLHVTRPHLGVDVAAPRGTRVSAPAAGRARYVGRKIGFGLVVELDHGRGITTRYAHLRSAAVQTGEDVTKGEAIGAVGTSGITTGPHLHYEVLGNGRQVDPLRFRFAGQAAPVALAPAVPAPAPAPAVTANPGAHGTAHDGAGPGVVAPPPR